MKMRVPIITFVWLVIVVIPCQGRIITVDDDGAADFNNIQAAIDDADDGDTVEVQAGTYTGDGNRDINFNGKAITVRSTDPNDPDIVAATIIDCNGTQAEPHRGFYFNNQEGGNSILAGLTIINGYGHNEQFGDYIRVAGGGVFCGNSNPTITKCRIRYNYASAGGGICCRQNDTAITDCIITNNSSDNGGGIYCGTIGADTNSPKIDNCFISNNSATTRGGGIRCGDNSQITNCVIISNAGVNGGGIGALYASTPTIRNCIIANNTRYGGGGGGISCQHGSLAKIINCTIAFNETAEYGGGIDSYKNSHPKISNCILWGNTAEWQKGHQIVIRPLLPDNPSYVTISHTDIEGGNDGIYIQNGTVLYWGIGNINIDPCFVNPTNNDWHLQSSVGRWDPNINDWVTDVNTSRCIDVGNPGCPLGSEPKDANNIRINMGAYGGTSEASVPPHSWALLADLNNDGTVNFQDYAHQSVDWEKTEDCQAGDLNRDGVIDMADIALLGEDWLKLTSWHEW